MNIFVLGSENVMDTNDSTVLSTAKHYAVLGHRVTAIIYQHGATAYQWSSMAGLTVQRFSFGLDIPGSGHLSGISRIGFLMAEIAELEMNKGNMPDAMEFVGNPALAHNVLQRKYCLHPLYHSIPVIVDTVESHRDANEEEGFALDKFWMKEMAHFSQTAADIVTNPDDVLDAFTEFSCRKLLWVYGNDTDTNWSAEVESKIKWPSNLQFVKFAVGDPCGAKIMQASDIGSTVVLLGAVDPDTRSWFTQHARLVIDLVAYLELLGYSDLNRLASFVQKLINGPLPQKDLFWAAHARVEKLKLLDRESWIKSRTFPLTSPVLPATFLPDEAVSLSVVVPYFNLGPYILDAIDSVMSSTYLPDEILIVDDGSTDPLSVRILFDVSRLSPRIHIIHQENSGIVTARNRGAMEARSKYIAFLDADDKVETTYFEKGISIMETYDNMSYVGSWGQFFGEADQLWPGWNPEPPYVLYHNTINSSGIIARRWIYLLYGLNHVDMTLGMEDYESIVNMVEHGFRGAVIPQALFYYRVRYGSRSQANRASVRQEVLYEKLIRLHDDFYKANEKSLSGLVNANGPGYQINSPMSYVPGKLTGG